MLSRSGKPGPLGSLLEVAGALDDDVGGCCSFVYGSGRFLANTSGLGVFDDESGVGYGFGRLRISLRSDDCETGSVGATMTTYCVDESFADRPIGIKV